MNEKIGTSEDSSKFRTNIENELKKAGQFIRAAGTAINEFAAIQYEPGQKKSMVDQLKAYQETNGIMIRKLQAVSVKIKEKMVSYQEYAQNVMNSMVSDAPNGLNRLDSSGQQDQLMVQNKGFQLTDEDQRMAQDAEYMGNIINQRKQDINTIADIMQDINSIAKDIAKETYEQGEKLTKLDEHITTAKVNVEKA